MQLQYLVAAEAVMYCRCQVQGTNPSVLALYDWCLSVCVSVSLFVVILSPSLGPLVPWFLPSFLDLPLRPFLHPTVSTSVLPPVPVYPPTLPLSVPSSPLIHNRFGKIPFRNTLSLQVHHVMFCFPSSRQVIIPCGTQFDPIDSLPDL